MNKEQEKGEELKPCPFCGELPYIHTVFDGTKMVYCRTRTGCAMSAGQVPLATWNIRTNPDIAIYRAKDDVIEAVKNWRGRFGFRATDTDVAFALKDAIDNLQELQAKEGSDD